MANLEVFEMTSDSAGWVPLATSDSRFAVEVEVALANVGMNKVQNLCFVCSSPIGRGNVCTSHRSAKGAVYFD